MLQQEPVADISGFGVLLYKEDQNLAWGEGVCALAVGVKGETPEGWAATRWFCSLP